MKPIGKSYAAPRQARLAALITEQADGEGFLPSPLPGVKYMKSTLHVRRSPIAYEPSIVIIAQGTKTGYLGGRKFVYDARHYLVLGVPLPFECETLGSPEEPVLGVQIAVNPTLVGELLLHLAPAADDSAHMIAAANLEDDLVDAAVRLLEALRTPDATKILAPQIVREIVYRVLKGKLGGVLRALAAPHSHVGQIGRVLNRLHTEYAQTTDLESLAREAGMSVSTFHTHFKAVTASSPLQYLKTIRLHQARMLMVHDGANAGDAAHRVGYESVSQFSREFKRLFGTTPSSEAERLRTTLVRLA